LVGCQDRDEYERKFKNIYLTEENIEDVDANGSVI
jgi:hypothetical protein